jgi:hypothetical protein
VREGTCAVLVFEDEGGLVASERMRAPKTTHHREVSNNVCANSIEAIAILRRPRAATGAEGVSSVRAVDEPTHVPHLHTGDLIDRQARDRETSKMEREGIGAPTIVCGAIDILEKDPVRGRQGRDRVLLQPARRTRRRMKRSKEGLGEGAKVSPCSTKEIESFC